MIRARNAGFWRRHLPEICAGLCGAALGLVFLYASVPARFLSRIVIVSGPHCGKSEHLVASILADSKLQDVFTPLSVSEHDDAVAASTCEIGYRHVIEEAPWFRLAERDWVCAELQVAADRYYDRAHGMLPVWVHDGAVLSVGERDELLRAAGYDLLPTGEGVVMRDDAVATTARSIATPRPASSEWRGQSIGF